jgi:hypothetical protein
MSFLFRAIGWGIVIYAVMYLLWSGLVIYGFAASIVSLGVRIVALIVITRLAARSLNLTTKMDVVPYSVSWAIIAIILDGLFLVPFSGWMVYAKWGTWAGYALVALAPILTFRISKLKFSARAETRKMPAGL